MADADWMHSGKFAIDRGGFPWLLLVRPVGAPADLDLRPGGRIRPRTLAVLHTHICASQAYINRHGEPSAAGSARAFAQAIVDADHL